MFGPPGHAYIYLIYGLHCCLNFVTNSVGEPDAVLLRGLAPIHGIDRMAMLRFGQAYETLTSYQRKNLCNGPGKCCQALSLDRSMDGMYLTGDSLFICSSLADVDLPEETYIPRTVRAGTRIGIDYAEEARDFLWRFTEEELHADF